MNDLSLLIIGTVVFGLMFIGMVLTVVEFRRIYEDEQAKSDADSSRSRPVLNDRD